MWKVELKADLVIILFLDVYNVNNNFNVIILRLFRYLNEGEMLFILSKKELSELLRTIGKLSPYHKIKALCSNAWNNPN